MKKLKWLVLLAKEREIEIKANNINAVVEKANVEKTKEERIVLRIKLKR